MNKKIPIEAPVNENSSKLSFCPEMHYNQLKRERFVETE